MPDRRPVVGGNWKMNTCLADGRALAAGIVAGSPDWASAVDVVVCPPFTSLAAIGAELDGTPIALGAQDVYPGPDGAFTGEISTAMLRDVGATWVIAGHSERRHVLGEDDATVNAKVRAALDAGLRVILCVGETSDQRDAELTETVALGQLTSGLKGVPAAMLDRVVIAYEPVWAIGTGRTATPDDAAAVHAALRTELAERYGADAAAAMRIQYGGSVKPGNAAELIAKNDIDGFLVGGASLDIDSFSAILRATAHAGATAQGPKA